MAKIKTQRTDSSVDAFLEKVSDEARRADCRTLVAMMKKAARAEPRMWGSSIVGFGDSRYKNASGHENDWFVVGFSPRKQDLTLYLMGGVDRQKPLLKTLGRHKTGKSCLYIKRLSDVDTSVLKEMIASSVQQMKQITKKH